MKMPINDIQPSQGILKVANSEKKKAFQLSELSTDSLDKDQINR